MDEKEKKFVEKSRPAIRRITSILEALEDATDIIRDECRNHEWEIAVNMTIVQEMIRRLLGVSIDSEDIYTFIENHAKNQIEGMEN